MNKHFVHQKSMSLNCREHPESSHSFVCLFIGWGEVARQHYYPNLKRLATYEQCFISVAETPGIANESTGSYIAWGSTELDELLLKGRFTHIFILTPPALHMAQLIYCLKRLEKVDHTTRIFIEKPSDFDPNRVRDAIGYWTAMQNRQKIIVRQIDHYVEKWPVRRLRERAYEVLDITGKLHEIVFFSAEKKRIPSSPTFTRGYAIEHGVHAWSILYRLFPMISKIPISLENNIPSRSWRYTDATSHCPADTAFLLRFITHPSPWECNELGPETRITIAGGKALGMDRKVLVLKGEKGKVVANLSHDKVVSIVRKKKKVLFKDDPTPRILPYRAMLEGILGKNPTPTDVTLPLEIGLWSLEKMREGISSVKLMEDYESGSMPIELQHLSRLLDNYF